MVIYFVREYAKLPRAFIIGVVSQRSGALSVMCKLALAARAVRPGLSEQEPRSTDERESIHKLGASVGVLSRGN